MLDLDTKSSTCSSIDNSLASVSLIFQDFCHFCRKIHKDHYIFENDFINMFGLIHTHCSTSHLHRNVNNLRQSTGKLLLPFILISKGPGELLPSLGIRRRTS